MRRSHCAARPIAGLVAIALTSTVAAACGAQPRPTTGTSVAASPVVVPSTSPRPSLAATTTEPTGSSGPQALRDGPLAPGTYLADPTAHPAWTACAQANTPGCSDPPEARSIRFTLTVPDGWTGLGPGAVWLTGAEAAPPDGASVGFGRGSWLHGDPCRTDLAPPTVEVGPTVDDFANALADNKNLEVTAPVDVTLAGYSGKYLDLQVPADLSACPTSYFVWEPGIYAQGPGQRWHLWILDVKGVRVVVQSTDYAGTSAQDRAELRAIVESIKIEA
jgi:hypothetical protein